MINSIKGNTISEADAKKKLNELNEIKKVEIKGKRLIENLKKLLSLFDNLLKTIFDKTDNESNSSTKNETVNESNSSTKNETVNKSNSNTKNKTVNKSNSSTKNETVNESNSSTKNETANESNSSLKLKVKVIIKVTMKVTMKVIMRAIIQLTKTRITIIDQTKSLEEQIEILKTKDFLYEYWSLKYYNDNKDLNYKIFKAEAAYLLTDLDKKYFKKYIIVIL